MSLVIAHGLLLVMVLIELAIVHFQKKEKTMTFLKSTIRQFAIIFLPIE